MACRLRYTLEVRESVRRLPPETKQTISATLDTIAQNPYEGVALIDELKGLWKYRAKRYRIVYEVYPGKREVIIHLIDRRETVYDRLKEALSR